MDKYFSFIVILYSVFFLSCGESGDNTDAGSDAGSRLCDPVQNPCPAGQQCNFDAKCVEADPLEISSADLPNGRVGFAYKYKIGAKGGIEPYSWFISVDDESLSFLSIDQDGTLRGTTLGPLVAAQLTVGVNDSGFGQGSTVERTYSISFYQCQNGDSELCYVPSGSKCNQGSRTCTNGQMGECLPGQYLSSDRNHCGPQCDTCNSDIADACVDGVCACGTGLICQAGQNCCGGECVDTQGSVSNCGSCFHDCELAISHSASSSKTCSLGTCDYLGNCDDSWLDCDGIRSNGCERPADRVDSCGACDIDCNDKVVHVPSSQKVCEQVQDGFICSYRSDCSQDFADCDSDKSNGCETWLTQAESCGDCTTDCSQSQLGSECISPDQADPYYHVCGCSLDPSSGGSIGCHDSNLCCHHVCVDGLQDTQNCGVCDAQCTSGSCNSSTCPCVTDEDCPKSSPATSCGNQGTCLCSYFQDGSSPCLLGQYCCDGQNGGSGGPDGDQDLGCCPKRCGWNDSENFPCAR